MLSGAVAAGSCSAATYSLVGTWARIQKPAERQNIRTEGPGPFVLLRDPKFYFLLPSNLFLPLVLTALFLYQIPLAETRGWSASTMAAAFVGFAVARMAVSLSVGPLIDRFPAVRILPFLLIPAFLGLAVLLSNVESSDTCSGARVEHRVEVVAVMTT